MREIKFRAWDNKKKEWLMGYEMPNLGGFSLFGECVLLGEWSSVLDTFLFDREGYKVDDLKVMQFTGLKDKNSKEIYEGDILQPFNKKGEKKGLICQVYWDDTFLTFSGLKDNKKDGEYMLTKSNYDCWEVIGNIYENPKLLK